MLGRGVGLALVLSSKYGQVKLQLTWCVSVQVHLFVQRGKKGTSREAEPVCFNLYGRNDGLTGERVKLSSFIVVILVGFCT